MQFTGGLPCTTEWAVLGQNLCFSKNFSVGPLASAYLDAKLVKVGVNGKEKEWIDKIILRQFPLNILLLSHRLAYNEDNKSRNIVILIYPSPSNKYVIIESH